MAAVANPLKQRIFRSLSELRAYVNESTNNVVTIMSIEEAQTGASFTLSYFEV